MEKAHHRGGRGRGQEEEDDEAEADEEGAQPRASTGRRALAETCTIRGSIISFGCECVEKHGCRVCKLDKKRTARSPCFVPVFVHSSGSDSDLHAGIEAQNANRTRVQGPNQRKTPSARAKWRQHQVSERQKRAKRISIGCAIVLGGPTREGSPNPLGP